MATLTIRTQLSLVIAHILTSESLLDPHVHPLRKSGSQIPFLKGRGCVPMGSAATFWCGLLHTDTPEGDSRGLQRCESTSAPLVSLHSKDPQSRAICASGIERN